MIFWLKVKAPNGTDVMRSCWNTFFDLPFELVAISWISTYSSLIRYFWIHFWFLLSSPIISPYFSSAPTTWSLSPRTIFYSNPLNPLRQRIGLVFFPTLHSLPLYIPFLQVIFTQRGPLSIFMEYTILFHISPTKIRWE